MFYDEIITKMIEVVAEAERSIPGNYKDMDGMEKLTFLCYQFYHLGYEDGKADKDIGSCLHEH